MIITKTSNILSQIDWLLVLMYLILVTAGWFAIYATTFSPEDTQQLIGLSTYYGKQFLFILFSLIIIVLILSLEASFYKRYSSILYIISLLLLVGLFLFGKTINDQTAWYSFGNFSFQPSEIAKITTALMLANIMSDNLFKIKKFSHLKNVLLVLFFPVVLILLQPDFGTAIVFFGFVFVLLREGMLLQFFLTFVALTILFISTVKFGVEITLITTTLLFILFFYYVSKRQKLFFRKNWPLIMSAITLVILIVLSSVFLYNKVLKQHHRDRLTLWLRMENNPQKIKSLKRTYGFNNDQSIKTVASGGFLGKGFLEGDRTNGNFVPEQHTDYIFSAIGEEFGFVGSSLIIIVFLLLILRIIFRAEQQRSKFSRIYGYGVASILFIHFVINIGMVLNLLPTIGIPLPFFSYGGSSLWGFTILLFIFIKLDANRKNEF